MLLNNSKVIIHVGFPRTATTLLQLEIEKHPDVLYLGKSNVSGARGKDKYITENIYNLHKYLDGGNQKEDISIGAIYNEINSFIGDNTNIKSIFMSDETLAKPWVNNNNWRHEFSERVHDIFPDATILFTIRRQDNIAKSLYARSYDQYLNGNEKFSTMSQWWDMGGGSIDTPFRERWSYYQLIKVFSDVYDGELALNSHVKVIPFEVMLSNSVKYKQYIANILNISPESLDFSRRVNQPKSTSLSTNQRFFTLKKEIKFSKRILDHLHHSFASENRKLTKYTDFNLGDLGYF